jgi:Membrane bound O-acyl transferase family
MSAVTLTKTISRFGDATTWLPLFAFPTAVVLLWGSWPRWLFMWMVALSIYAGCKWLSFAHALNAERGSLPRRAGYLILWPGMDATAFLRPSSSVEVPKWSEWLAALGKLALGGALIVAAIRIVDGHPQAAAWTAVVGIVLVLHFGIFHMLSLCWRQNGVNASPIMRAPIMASSLSDFWGRRWNAAFRDLAHAYVFRPLVGCMGVAAATMAAFLVSGLVHDLVISLPARGGYGLPTLYFALQGLGLLAERSRLGKHIGLGRGLVGWLFCMIVTAAPLCLLVHPPFVERIAIPMLAAWRSAAFAVPPMRAESLIFIGGILHFGILLASALVPVVLDWKGSLAKLDRLPRQLIWVHGLFIVLVIVAFGALSLFFSSDLAGGTRLARALCCFIAVFWATRLAIQLFVFDAKPYLSNVLLRVGYHGLTLVFTYLACAYAWAAF